MVACHKSVSTPAKSRRRGWPPPSTRMRAVRTGSLGPSHEKIPATSPILRGGVDPRRWYIRSSLRQKNHSCATKRCKSPPADMQKSHDWNVVLTNMAKTVRHQSPVVQQMDDWCGFLKHNPTHHTTKNTQTNTQTP